MQNTSCSQSFDVKREKNGTDAAQGGLDFPHTATINVLGHNIEVKNYICSSDGINYGVKDKARIQLTIIPTSFCPCSCPFCIAHANRNDKAVLDVNKLEKTLISLRKDDVVRGIKITGGEPMLLPDLVSDIIDMIYDIWGDKYFEVSLDTSGVDLEGLLRIKKLSCLDQVHISRHHYDDEINRSIFGAAVPDMKELKAAIRSVSYRDLFVMNCMLMKDYIGSREEIHKYLDHAIDIGVGKVSFITGNPINSFIAGQALDYAALINEDDPAYMFTRGYFDYDICRCRDGVYVSGNGDLIEFYGKCTVKDSGADYARGLVYRPDNRLTCGYGGEEIYHA